MIILVTGCAGFIGFHLSRKLLKNKNYKVFGIDNLNSYYEKKLKIQRLDILNKNKNFNFSKIDISNSKKLEGYLRNKKITHIVHLAAQAGVRYSIHNPKVYVKSNLVGFFNILEIARKKKIKHLVFASTSSVYGSQNKFPLKENYNTDKPLSFYAATKKSNEVMAYSYSNIYKLPSTCLRFFTVYGPYGRPDMSLFLFIKSIMQNKTINLFNKGQHTRDFTYIDDCVNSINAVLRKPPKEIIPYDVFNVSSSKPISLKSVIDLFKQKTNKTIKVSYLPIQLGDVKKTHGSNSKITRKFKYNMKTSFNLGLTNFLKWYKEYK